ncbi:pentatricopeptide repeat-containing protein At5g16860-like [Apium graveolens]|uniref:pentatricopeptide repeat-containing protein At5g16860-like n=1 Tax=Apium graveolens TaxID=4045 RepID=UPI003D79C1C6
MCFVSNALAMMYFKSGVLRDAQKVFDEMCHRVSLFNVLPACGVGKVWRREKDVHGYVIRSGLSEDVSMGNAIVDIYTKFELMDKVSKVFKRMKVKDVVSWNTMGTGYSQVGRFEDALSLFERMKMETIDLNVVTWSALIGEWVLGFCVQEVVVKKGFVECNVFVCNALAMMYFKSGVSRDAQKVFDEICHRGVEDVVSGNSIMVAYAQSGDVQNALRLFERMWRRDSLVRGRMRSGKEVHGHAVRSGQSEDVSVGNTFVDMYTKCELMDEASKVFKRTKVKDVVSWNTMVTGYSQVGRFEDDLSLFERMKMEKIDLNMVMWSAFIGVYAHGTWLRSS